MGIDKYGPVEESDYYTNTGLSDMNMLLYLAVLLCVVGVIGFCERNAQSQHIVLLRKNRVGYLVQYAQGIRMCEYWSPSDYIILPRGRGNRKNSKIHNV